MDGHEIGQRDADPAEADRKPGRRDVRQGRRGARPAHARHEPRRPDRLQKLDGGHVERKLEGPAERDRAVELAIEILGRIAGEIDRPVLDQRFGVGDAASNARP
jgi:hypothetical protein